jgi:hypothetical protein
MKYLKRYAIFESVNSEVLSYINDILLDLSDDGFNIKYENSYFSKDNGVVIRIKRNNLFLLENIYEYILTIDSYLKTFY